MNRSHRDASGTTFLATGLTYDAKGQVTSEIEGNLGRTYTYDAVGQITNVSYQDANGNWSSNPPLAYDATGNRTGFNDTPIAGNRMGTAAGETLSYDANGAVTGRTSGTTNWAYAYDERGQVTSATQTVGSTVQQRVTYAYDAFGNRLSRADGAGTTRYALDLWDTAKSDPVGTDTRAADDDKSLGITCRNHVRWSCNRATSRNIVEGHST